MKSRVIICLLFLAFVVSGLSASEKGPVAVSPGNDVGIAQVGQNCPTFSWTAVEWATGYRIILFEAATAEVVSYEEMAVSTYPVLDKEIDGRAFSWTPSINERLRNGRMYVWYVQAMDAYGTAEWSEGKVFMVNVSINLVGMEERVRGTLREHGVSEDVIAEVLDGMRSEAREESVSAGGSQGSGYNTTEPIKIQGNEIGSNTWYGEDAGFSLTTGVHNSYFGYHAGYSNSTANGNTIMGYNAGYNNIGDSNTFIGRGVGYTNTSGFRNVFVGRSAGEWNNTGNYNTFIGAEAGFKNTDAHDNVFIGECAGWSNTMGNSNTFMGRHAGYNNETGHENTFIGTDAGRNNVTGDSNVFLGYLAGHNETGSNKLYIDNSDSSSPLIYGEFDNDIVGINGKLGVGTQSPEALLEIVNPSGRSDLVLNRNDGATFAFEAKLSNVRFGSLTAHGLKLMVGGDPKVTINTDGSLEMSSGATCTAAGVWTDASSRAYKENIHDLTIVEAKDALLTLNPVKYNYKKDKEEEYLGFIAEDVPELVASKDRKGMSPMDVVAVLTKVVQEQQEIITELQKRIAMLEMRSEAEK